MLEPGSADVTEPEVAENEVNEPAERNDASNDDDALFAELEREEENDYLWTSLRERRLEQLKKEYPLILSTGRDWLT
jgi:hypothetical protein